MIIAAIQKVLALYKCLQVGQVFLATREAFVFYSLEVVSDGKREEDKKDAPRETRRNADLAGWG